MSKKREKIRRKRQLTKTRTGHQRTARTKASKPPTTRPEEKAKASDVWFAVGILVVIVGVFVGLYYFAVRRPAEQSTSATTSPLATSTGPVVSVETAAASAAEPSPTPTATAEPKGLTMSWSEAPKMSLDNSKEYEALIETEKGTVRVELFADKVPVTVNNFVFLARQGYYDGVTFHRVLPGFMAQTGDPTGTGSGGPGYRFEDEFDSSLRHDSEGILSMANAGPNTNGSQFFITYVPTPHLDDVHSVFGKVIEGMDVVKAITPRDPGKNPGAPAGDKILTIEIIEK